VFTALQSGSIDLIRSRIITEGTRSLDKHLRVAVADTVLAKTPTQAPSTLRAAVARAVHILDPTGTEERHKADLTDRRITLTPRENGMSELWAFLPADRAAADATWQRLLTDPATGALTDIGRTHYTPPAALAEYGLTRDRRCRFSGCRQPRIDLDHPIPYPAGPTADYNLAGLCRHHHRLKQHPRWHASLQPMPE